MCVCVCGDNFKGVRGGDNFGAMGVSCEVEGFANIVTYEILSSLLFVSQGDKEEGGGSVHCASST